MSILESVESTAMAMQFVFYCGLAFHLGASVSGSARWLEAVSDKR